MNLPITPAFMTVNFFLCSYMGNALSAIVFTAYTSKRCCVACDTVKIVRY